MKKNKVLLISSVSLIIVVIGLVVSITFGWLSIFNSNTGGTVSVGSLTYEKAGDFITDSQVIYPGMELLDTDFTLTNNSTITSQLRIRIDYTKVTNPGTIQVDTVSYTDAVDEHLAVVFGTSFTYDNNYWYYDGLSGVVPAESGLMSLITSISYNGTYAGLDYSGQTVDISVTIEVKQSDNVTWSELTAYDFQTGYPA